MDIRIGNGLDFHRLIQDIHRPLILGGATIESDFALQGHSDADIILHALSDALLGAIAGPDIGELFPDTDPSLKGMDSTRIVEKALSLLKEKGFSVSNVDITVIGERPRLKPHKEAIRNSLCRLLGIDAARVGIKATTTEKMGFAGRGEGLGCMATALLIKP